MAKTKQRKQSTSTISPTLIILVSVAAILVVGGLILLNNQSTDVDVSGFPYLGDENAPVVIVEYSDYG